MKRSAPIRVHPLLTALLRALPCLALLLASPAEAKPPLRGTLVEHSGQLAFVPCKQRGKLAIIDATPGRGLARLYRELGGRPGADVFIEAAAKRQGGKLRVLEVRRAYREGLGCREDLRGIAFKALGNEPAWNLQATRRGLHFRRMGEEWLFPYRPPEPRASVLVYESQTQTERIEAMLERSPCRDSMADAVYSYRALVTFRGQLLHGCAYFGDGVKP